MRIGILSDPHLSFSRYSKVNEKGINQREADFYGAFVDAVENLLNADVEAILDLGDLADTPHPKKRALHILIQTINATGLPWWSVNGNHTLVRHSTDIHLYDVLQHYCKRFTGIQHWTNVEALGNALLVPYGTSYQIKMALHLSETAEPAFIAGHWACNDVLPDGHDITVGDLPGGDIPVMLGHFHGRRYVQSLVCQCANDGWYTHDHSEFRVGSTFVSSPVYIGATERKAWGEARNPTGAAVYDTESQALTFIDHKTRDWVDLTADASTYLDVLDDALGGRDDQPIVRLTIEATREEYRNVDELAAHRIAAGALDLTIRRQGAREEEQAAAAFIAQHTLTDDWHSQVKDASIPKGVLRSDVEQRGVDALSAAGVAA